VLRDYGRIGQLMLDKGMAGRRRIVSIAWVAESTATAPGPDAMPALSLGYAYLWWTLKGTQAFTALGGEGQILLVDPASHTVIVKLSHLPIGPEGARMQTETFAMLKAILVRPPRD